jgi:predicted deacylase
MPALRAKYIAIALGIVFMIGIGVFTLTNNQPQKIVAVPPLIKKIPVIKHAVIGTSVDGRSIETYTYGNGPTHLLFVGGIHGGYEWNSVLVAYELMDYISAHPEAIPKNLTVAIIPSLNPDGVYRVIKKEGRFTIADVPTVKEALGTGRMNAHNIDLNRNFDCNWKPQSTWQNKIVSAGTHPFSEPEANALRNFVTSYAPASVVFWHSQANTVYASACNAGVLPETVDIMNAYARAAGYNAVKTFTAYKTSGDSEGWLASIGIPAITVELKTHETVEWSQNLAGIQAIFKYYAH